MTGDYPAGTFSLVREWAYEDFSEFLEARMRAEGIRNDAELSRLSGINQTQISNWRRGRARPSPESLDKIAAIFRVPSTVLYELSGHLAERDPSEPDLRVAPAEFRDLITIYGDGRLSDEDRAFLRRNVGMLVSSLLTDLSKRSTPPPTKRTRRGRPAA